MKVISKDSVNDKFTVEFSREELIFFEYQVKGEIFHLRRMADLTGDPDGGYQSKISFLTDLCDQFKVFHAPNLKEAAP